MSNTNTPDGSDLGIDLSEFAQAFFEEAAEHLANMEQLLLAMDQAAPSSEDLNAIFRAAHSIKGGSAMFGFTDLTHLTHELESLLDKVRKGDTPLSAEMVDVLLQSGDMTKLMLARHSGDSTQAAPPADELCARIRAFLNPGQTGGERGTAPKARNAAARSPQAAAVQAVASPDDPGYGFFEDFPPGAAIAAAEPQPVHAGRRAGDLEDSPGRSGPTGRRENDKAVSGENLSIRVNIEKVDQLINQLGEVVITQAMLSESVSRLDPIAHQRLFKCMSDLERNTRDLQESVMSIRMTPVSVVFNRTPRMVRDLAAKLGKKVQVVMEGEGTELDRGLIEKISDPLTHLVRNSVDHGIELPEQRVASGKAETGTVILRASHQGGNIVIEICDDGAGLNREKILSKARERGIPISDSMSDADVWQLIFEAGFSTAEVVTDVSGRGVGMDVVKRNIQALGGRVEIESKPAMGTRITIRLPLTLAILDGLSVAVADQLFIIPLGYIVESLQPKASDVKSISRHGQVIQVRGDYLPVVKLHEAFNIVPRCADIEQGIMLILESDGMKKAVFVDELLGQHQVVIKSLETNYRKVDGISGATIMGDGKVALIIDAGAIVRSAGPGLQAAA